jgi:hypothetical protein
MTKRPILPLIIAAVVATSAGAVLFKNCQHGVCYTRLAKTTNTTQVAHSPAVTPTPTPTSGMGLIAPIADNFDPATEMVPAWGNGAIPETAAPDVVGAFRFTCFPSHENSDDPLVYAGQPGKSHLHQFFGNTKVNAYSTYGTLRTTGDSTCMSKLNRSGYWTPAMIDASGSVIRPIEYAIYYKRCPAGSAECARRGSSASGIPTGIGFTYGFDMKSMTKATGSAFWKCVQTNKDSDTMTGALAGCPNGSLLEWRIEAPDCWNGKDTASANQRDHVAYAKYGDDGVLRCPTTHPVTIPQFTLGEMFRVTDALRTARLSSDIAMGTAQGVTAHADYMEAWSPVAKAIWTTNCIDKLLNCSGGDLGSGSQLRGQP